MDTDLSFLLLNFFVYDGKPRPQKNITNRYAYQWLEFYPTISIRYNLRFALIINHVVEFGLSDCCHETQCIFITRLLYLKESEFLPLVHQSSGEKMNSLFL